MGDRKRNMGVKSIKKVVDIIVRVNENGNGYVK